MSEAFFAAIPDFLIFLPTGLSPGYSRPSRTVMSLSKNENFIQHNRSEYDSEWALLIFKHHGGITWARTRERERAFHFQGQSCLNENKKQAEQMQHSMHVRRTKHRRPKLLKFKWGFEFLSVFPGRELLSLLGGPRKPHFHEFRAKLSSLDKFQFATDIIKVMNSPQILAGVIMSPWNESEQHEKLVRLSIKVPRSRLVCHEFFFLVDMELMPLSEGANRAREFWIIARVDRGDYDPADSSSLSTPLG